MNSDALAFALAETARKRRLLGWNPSQRLAEAIRASGCPSVADLRDRLGRGDGFSPHLAGQLLECVVAADAPPFGEYLPITHLADGGMGSVYLACSPANEVVVIKTLKQGALPGMEASHAAEFAKRFQREARITQHLNHANVVRCLGDGQAADGTLFMVLEYVDSGDLKDLVDARHGLTEGLALAILYQAVDALAAAHALKLVHRDIKPANIFVSSKGVAKLADFGIARSTSEQRTMLTMQGAVMGSPQYMSPEQVLGAGDLDIRSDLYAFGIVLYYCLAAEPPFNAKKLQDVLHAQCTAPVPDIRKLRPQISETAHRIITTCMAKEREKRYRDPAELRDALANALVRLGLTPGKVEESTRPVDLAGAAAGSGDDRTIAADLAGDGVLPAGSAEMPTATLGTAAQPAPDHSSTARTILTADLQQRPAAAISSADMATMAGTLMTVAMDGPPTMGLVGATMATVASAPTSAAARLDGDLATALAGDWITLRGDGDGAAVVLLARAQASLGKLRDAPNDLCIRNYPVATHKDACMRISRQHVQIRCDQATRQAMLTDLGAANGTLLDGIRVAAKTDCPLAADEEHLLLLAEVAVLRVRVHARANPAVVMIPGATPTPIGGCGLDTDWPYDAITLTRPENRTELAYVLILRRLTIGGPGADLVVAGARTKAQVEIAPCGGRWIWRTEPTTAWKPLTAADRLDIGGRTMHAEVGGYHHFD